MIGTSWDKTHLNMNNEKCVHVVIVGATGRAFGLRQVCVYEGCWMENGSPGVSLCCRDRCYRWHRRYNEYSPVCFTYIFHAHQSVDVALYCFDVSTIAAQGLSNAWWLPPRKYDALCQFYPIGHVSVTVYMTVVTRSEWEIWRGRCRCNPTGRNKSLPCVQLLTLPVLGRRHI